MSDLDHGPSVRRLTSSHGNPRIPGPSRHRGLELLGSRAIRRKRRKLVLWLPVLAVLAWAGATGAFALSSVQRPSPRASEPLPSPSVLDGVDEFRLATEDGLELGAWLAHPAEAKVAVVLLHGLGSSRSSQTEIIAFLSRAGCAVLAPSLRSHGDSEGDRIDFGYSSRLDVLAAVAKLEETNPDLPIIIFGRSMGAAAALFAAEELDHRVAAYLLESPYADLDTATRNRLLLRLPEALEGVVLFALKRWANLLLPIPFDDIAPVRHASAIPESVPIVILAGALDRHATIDEAKFIVKQAQEHTTLVLFTDAAHDELWGKNDLLYKHSIMALVERVSSTPAGPGAAGDPSARDDSSEATDEKAPR